MLQKGKSQLKVNHENLQQQHFRTSWVQSSGTDFHNIPQIEWSSPPRFMVNPNWKMEAGSESQETHIQLQRESVTAEEIYYDNYDIPPNPSVALNTLDFNDSSKITVIPLDVINDGTSPDDPLIISGPTIKIGEKTTQPLLQRDKVMGTAVALVALIKSKEPGSQIDLELLIQLLRNPGMLDQLMKEHGLMSNQSLIITPAELHEHSSVPLLVPRPTSHWFPEPKVHVGGHSTWSTSVPFSHNMSQGLKNMLEQIHRDSESKKSSSSKVDVGKIRKLINEYGIPLGVDSVKPGPAVVKDADYYRRLVLLHGVTQESSEPHGSVKTIGSQEQRPCVYFNSPNGCRRGSSCWFLHVKGGLGEGNWAGEEQQGAKRTKLSGGNFVGPT